MLRFSAVIMTAGSLEDFVCTQLPLLNANFMARYSSAVMSKELTGRSMYFAIELLCPPEHSWELK